jgi:hypothetical protein
MLTKIAGNADLGTISNVERSYCARFLEKKIYRGKEDCLALLQG